MHTNKRKYALRNFDIVLLLLFAAFICVITTAKIIEDDVFIHLVTGKFIVENKTVPSADIFGYLTQGTPWIPYEWVWQAITYIAWKTGGYELMSVLRTLIILLFFLVYYLLLKKLSIPLPLFIVLSILMCTGLLGRLVIRPHIVSYLFMALLVSILLRYKYFGFKKDKFIYFIPVIFLAWANIHMGVILGLAVFGMFLCSETALRIGRNKIFRNNKNIFSLNDLKLFYLAFAVSFAVIFINPHFADTYAYVFRLLSMPQLEYINEWASPFDERFISSYYVNAYFIFLFLGLSILYYSYKHRELFPAILYITIGIFSMKSLRYTADFINVIFIPLAVSLNFILKNLKQRTDYLNSIQAKLSVSVLLIFLTAFTANNGFYKFLKVPFRETGFGINENYFSGGLFDFMERQKVSETGSRPFNSMKIGGYFLWRFEGKKDFIDSRCLSGDIINEYMKINSCRNDFAERLKSYDVDYIIYCVPTITARPFQLEMNLVAYLSRNENWKLIYWDDISLLFVRNEDKFSNLISGYEYKYLTPLNCYFHRNIIINAVKKDNQQLMKEINRKLYEDKNGEVINDIVKYLNLKSISSLR